MRKEKTLGIDKKKVTAVERSLTVLGFYCFGADSLSKEVAGFSPFMVSPRKKHYVHCLLCLIAVLVILSVTDPNNDSLMLKN